MKAFPSPLMEPAALLPNALVNKRFWEIAERARRVCSFARPPVSTANGKKSRLDCSLGSWLFRSLQQRNYASTFCLCTKISRYQATPRASIVRPTWFASQMHGGAERAAAMVALSVSSVVILYFTMLDFDDVAS